MSPRELPEVVSELIIEMHEVRSEPKAATGQLDRLARSREGVEVAVKLGQGKVGLLREKNRQNTDRLIDAFSRSMAPLIGRVPNHEPRPNTLKNPSSK